MGASVIRAKLDLLVRLIDTTTGAPVDEKNIIFKRNGMPVRPEGRGAGTYVFINTGREDFLMRVEVYGFEDYEVSVSYEELDEALPECDVFLMPSESRSRGLDIVSFSGTLPFLKKIEAVNLSKPLCITGEYDARKGTMSVIDEAGKPVSLTERHYGLLSGDKNSYEKIEVSGMIPPQSVRLVRPLQEEFAARMPIMRIVYGSVNENGDYLLRVAADTVELKYLVRYEAGDEVRFQLVDMYSQEALK